MNWKVAVLVVLSLLGALFVVCPQNVKADSAGPIHFSDGVTLLSPVNATYNTPTFC